MQFLIDFQNSFIHHLLLEIAVKQRQYHQNIVKSNSTQIGRCCDKARRLLGSFCCHISNYVYFFILLSNWNITFLLLSQRVVSRNQNGWIYGNHSPRIHHNDHIPCYHSDHLNHSDRLNHSDQQTPDSRHTICADLKDTFTNVCFNETFIYLSIVCISLNYVHSMTVYHIVSMFLTFK